jgi:hypothetical protein
MEGMRLPLAAAATLLALSVPRLARGEPSVGLRLAVAPAVGSAAGDLPVSDAVRLQFPLQLDALWAFGPIAVGGYASWGLARVGACGGSCDGSVVRAGLEAIRTFASSRRAVPWAGIGAGYEWATEHRARAGHARTTRWRGFELLAVQGGLEWRVARAVALGPFLLVGAGRYTDVSLDTGIESASEGIARRAFHAWIHAGVRGRLVLGGAR